MLFLLLFNLLCFYGDKTSSILRRKISANGDSDAVERICMEKCNKERLVQMVNKDFIRNLRSIENEQTNFNGIFFI